MDVSPAFRMIGGNDVRLFGLPPKERMRRFAANAGLSAGADDAGAAVLANLDYACDPAWFPYLRKAPGTVVTVGGVPALAHAADVEAARAITAAMSGESAFALPPGHREVRAEAGEGLNNDELRKREAPFVMRLTPDTADAAERASYDGAYKGVTDALTLYLWRRPAFYLTRWSAAAGLSPNFITIVGAMLCVAAFYLFWMGDYWLGIAAAFVFMVLDTVDGKLARCTGTSSKWGHVLDHGIDLLHPPFWWWAWAQGLEAYGTPYYDGGQFLIPGIILVGYVAQRLIEGVFIGLFKMHIHVWRRVDSHFRLVTARRNPNMVILVVALMFGSPDLGLVMVMVWTILSLLFHVIRLAQAAIWRAMSGPLESWLA